MTEKQILKHYQLEIRGMSRQLKLLAQLKIKLDSALDRQKYGHSDGWEKVQKQLDKIDDNFDCVELI